MLGCWRVGYCFLELSFYFASHCVSNGHTTPHYHSTLLFNPWKESWLVTQEKALCSSNRNAAWEISVVTGVLELRRINIESWKWRHAKNCSSQSGHLRLAPRVSEPCGSWNNHVDSVMVIWNNQPVMLWHLPFTQVILTQWRAERDEVRAQNLLTVLTAAPLLVQTKYSVSVFTASEGDTSPALHWYFLVKHCHLLIKI